MTPERQSPTRREPRRWSKRAGLETGAPRSWRRCPASGRELLLTSAATGVSETRPRNDRRTGRYVPNVDVRSATVESLARKNSEVEIGHSDFVIRHSLAPLHGRILAAKAAVRRRFNVKRLLALRPGKVLRTVPHRSESNGQGPLRPKPPSPMKSASRSCALRPAWRTQ